MGVLCIIILSYTMSVAWRKKWIETLPVSMFIIMLLTYSIGIFNCLYNIWILKWGILFGSVGVLLFYLRKKDGNVGKIKDKVSIGLLLLVGVSIIMAFLLSSHLIIEWDDLSHWATTVKQMYYINAIPNGQNAISGYNDYPPIGSLMIYWFLSDFEEFHEFLIFPVYNLGILVCLAPFYERIPEGKSKVRKQIIAFLVCLLLPGAFASTAMVNLKIDSFVAVLFMYIVIAVLEVVFREDKLYFWDWLKIFAAISVMTVAKSVGIYLTIVVTFGLFIFALNSKNKKYVTMCIAGTGMEAFFYLSWKVFCHIYGNASYISEEFGKIQIMDYLRTIKAILVQMPWFLYPILAYTVGMLLFAILMNKDKISEKGKQILLVSVVCIDIFISFFCRYGYLYHWFERLVNDESKEYVTKHYIYYFCCQSITFQREEYVTYGMSALECIMLITIIMLLVRFSTGNKKYKEYLMIQVPLWIGFIVYVVGQLAMYRYMFSGGESSVLSAYSRYLMMYLGGLLGGTFYLLYCGWINSEDKKRLSGLSVLLASIIFISNIPFAYMCIFQYHEGYFAVRWGHREKGIAVVEKIRQEMENTEDGIWITNSDDGGWTINETRYHFTPDRGLEFNRAWILDNVQEETLIEMIETSDAERKIRYLAVDMSEDFSIENQKKLDKILEYYQIEEQNDFPVCVYRL